MTGFGRWQRDYPQRLKPLAIPDVAALLERCPDTNLLKLPHYEWAALEDNPAPLVISFLGLLETRKVGGMDLWLK
jgi:hypothetical protein